MGTCSVSTPSTAGDLLARPRLRPTGQRRVRLAVCVERSCLTAHPPSHGSLDDTHERTVSSLFIKSVLRALARKSQWPTPHMAYTPHGLHPTWPTPHMPYTPHALHPTCKPKTIDQISLVFGWRDMPRASA